MPRSNGSSLMSSSEFHPMCGTGMPGAASRRSTRPPSTPRQAVSPSEECSNSSCMPRHTPSSGTRSRGIRRSSPEARSRRMASAAAPTPGSSTRGAPAMTPASLLTIERAPRRSSAYRSEARLAPPLSMMATSMPPLMAHRCSQCALGARQVVAVAPQRRPQRAANRLEAGFDHVMCVLPAHRQMQRRAEALCQGAKEVRHQLAGQLADLFAAEVTLEHEVGAAGQVDRDLRLALIHRQQKTVAADPGLVAERLAQRLADGQRAILDRVMLIDVQIPAAAQLQLKAAVPGELLEHVIEESDAGLDVTAGRTVELELQLDVGFARLTAQLRAPCEQRARD